MHFIFMDQLLSAFSPDIGIDLGTANTPVTIRGKGIRLREPSYVALEHSSGKVIAVGNEAKMMEGRTPPSIAVIRPIKDGVIAEFDIAYQMMKYLLQRTNTQGILRPRVMVGVPSDSTDVESRAVSEAARAAGARVVYIISQPLAAAIGAGMEVLKPKGNMIVDIGGGTSEVAVISLGGIVLSRSIRSAGDKMDETIVNYVRKTHDLLIGSRSAEEIKLEIGSALPSKEPLKTIVKGRNLLTGLPASIELNSNEICQALSEILQDLVEMIKNALEATPPELVSDIVQHGITLSGGGSQLSGLNIYLSKLLAAKCQVAEDPLSSVVRGQEKLFKDAALLRKIVFKRT